MGLKKGQTNNKDGRPTGSKNEKTKQWEALGEAIVTTHAERFNRILETAEDENFQRYFTMILEYFKPKQSRAELTGEVNTKITVEFKDAE